MRSTWLRLLGGALVLAGVLLTGLSAQAAFSSGSTGADGPYAPTSSTTLTPPPSGVFNFTTITIPAGVTVTLAPNATNTPATLLATGDVTIAGTLDLSGKPGGAGVPGGTVTAPNGGLPGPGGGLGGSGSVGSVSTTGGRGIGPGGGTPGSQQFTTRIPDCAGAGAGHNGAGGNGVAGNFTSCNPPGGPGYGGPRLLPLLGGSGGGGGSSAFGSTAGGGGGGGGALLLASSTEITLTGTIRANGGNGGSFSSEFYNGGAGGGGSGGAIRLVTPLLSGSGGSIQVTGGTGGSPPCFNNGDAGYACGSTGGAGAPGRIRLEADTLSLAAAFTVSPSQGPLGTVTLSGAPSLQFTSVAGLPAPAIPQGSYLTPDVNIPAGFTNPVAIVLQASQIPLGTVVTVTSTPLQAGGSSATGVLTGTLAASTVSVNLTLPTNEPTILTATANFAVAAAMETGPLYADGPVPSFVEGEEVTRVKVAAAFGGASSVTYVTGSGREILLR